MLYPDIPSVNTLHFDIRNSVYTNSALQTGEFPDKQTITLKPVYTVRSLLLSAAAVPFYLVATLLSVSPIPIIALFFNSMIISLISVIILLFSNEIYGSKKVAFVLSLVFGVGSFIWPYHTSFWSMPLQALCLISATYFIHKSLHYDTSFIHNYARLDFNVSSNRKNIVSSTYDKYTTNKGLYFAALGGLFLGLSVYAHPTSIILIPGFVAFCFVSAAKRNKASFGTCLTALAITLLSQGVINQLKYGSFAEFGYGHSGSLAVHNGWHGLVGLIGSPGAGLIFFFPISILLPLAFKYMYGLNKEIFFLCAYVIIVTWLYVGTSSFGFEPYAWSGAIAWGPRYLIPVLPFIILVLGSLLSHLKEIPPKPRLFLKILIIILCVAGFCVNLVGTLVWYQYGIMYGWSKDQLWKNNENMEIMTWNPYYSPIILHAKVLLSDFVSQIHPEDYVDTAWYWTDYGLAPCSYDVYIYCKFGIVPFALMVVGIAALLYVIMLEIRTNPTSKDKATFGLKSFVC